MTWGRFLIDAAFPGGKKHSNSGDSVKHMVRYVVTLIRKHYHVVMCPSSCVSTAVSLTRSSSSPFEELGIGYI